MDEPPREDSQRSAQPTATSTGDSRTLLADLRQAQDRIAHLEAELSYLRAHADNLDRAALRERRAVRKARTTSPAFQAAAGMPATTVYEADAWKQRYEEVVNSLSWRLMWWLGTPYRFLLTRRPRATASPRSTHQ